MKMLELEVEVVVIHRPPFSPTKEAPEVLRRSSSSSRRRLSSNAEG